MIDHNRSGVDHGRLETKAAFARLATEAGNAEAWLDARFGRWAHHLFRAEFGSARETAKSFLREAERAERPTEVGPRIEFGFDSPLARGF
jgi:hypothetical protein